MCVGGSSIEIDDSTMSGPRDTSKELIKSKYALSEENQKKNASILAGRNKAKSLVAFNNSDDNDSGAKGTKFSGSTVSYGNNYGGMDMSNIG